ncbi:MAG: chemotaxis protein CheW [Spirochaetia bacterium]|nr:chemotaxis protein CheW [Spirochaetia bacterium]
MAEKTNRKYVTFRIGNEIYGIDIMLIHSIVDYEDVRSIPNAPAYVEGLYNLRGEVIPIINLHSRFQIPVAEIADKDAVDGIIIIDVENCKVGLVVDSVLKIIEIDTDEIQQSSAGHDKIGNAYVTGVYVDKNEYIVILDAFKIFAPKEWQRISEIG